MKEKWKVIIMEALTMDKISPVKRNGKYLATYTDSKYENKRKSEKNPSGNQPSFFFSLISHVKFTTFGSDFVIERKQLGENWHET